MYTQSRFPALSQGWKVDISSPESPKDLTRQAPPAPQTPVGSNCSENMADIG